MIAGMIRTRVLGDLVNERARQDSTWGVQNHSPIEWAAIITEECGEAAREAVKGHFGNANSHLPLMREELIQLAAVTIAAIESLDRNELQ